MSSSVYQVRLKYKNLYLLFHLNERIWNRLPFLTDQNVETLTQDFLTE